MDSKENIQAGFNRQFGERLRAMRDGLSLSRHAFAARVGIGVSTLQRYEEGWLPKGNAIFQISQDFNVSADWLLFGTGEMRRGSLQQTQTHTSAVNKDIIMPDLDNTFFAVFERLKIATTSETDTALARKLGKSQGSISTAKMQRVVPSSWIIQISQDFNVSADWLLFGTGQMRRGSLQQTQTHTSAFQQDVETMLRTLSQLGATQSELKEALLAMAGCRPVATSRTKDRITAFANTIKRSATALRRFLI